MPPAFAFASLFGAAVVLGWRLRETRRPVSAVKLLAPPLGMATGFSMFVYPPTRVPLSWGLAAFVTGALLLSYPLIATSRLERVGDAIVMQRSRAFLWVIFGLLFVRLAARAWVEQHLSAMQTGSLFFLLAFGMLLPWRVATYLTYRRMRAYDPGR